MTNSPVDEAEFLDKMADELTGNALNSSAWMSLAPSWTTKNQLNFLSRELKYLRQCLQQFEIPDPGLTSISMLYDPTDPTTLKRMVAGIAKSLSQPKDTQDRRAWLNHCCIGASHLRGTLCVIGSCAPAAIAFAERRNPPIDSTTIATMCALDFRAPTIAQVDAAIALSDRLAAIAKIDPLSAGKMVGDNIEDYHPADNRQDKNTDNKAGWYRFIITALEIVFLLGLWELGGVFFAHNCPLCFDICSFLSLGSIAPYFCLVIQERPHWTKRSSAICLISGVLLGFLFSVFYGLSMAYLTSAFKSRFAIPSILSLITAIAWYVALRAPTHSPKAVLAATRPNSLTPDSSSRPVLFIAPPAPAGLLPSFAPTTMPTTLQSKSIPSTTLPTTDNPATQRSLSQEQIDGIKSKLSYFKNQRISIWCVPNDLEAARYAQSFFTAFHLAGWDTGEAFHADLRMMTLVPVLIGMSKDNNSDEHIPGNPALGVPGESRALIHAPYSSMLFAFSELGIKHDVGFFDVPKGEIRILVGPKS